MPELPEVEVTRLTLVHRITGSQIMGIRIGKSLRWPLGCSEQDLVGRRVLGVRRRGKYLLLDLSQGLLLVHLGMSGSLTFANVPGEPGTHDHFDLRTTLGVLRLHDPRRFGAVVFSDSESSDVAQKLLGGLGMEPLDEGFETTRFYAELQRRRAPIKQVLLQGNVVVGVGNIYASEALFRAAIRPTVRAQSISRPRATRLHGAIRAVLADAVNKGGSTLRDFSNAQGEAGHYQSDAMVYGRAGQACRVCGTLVRLIRQGQRSTFFCATCQKP